MSYILEALKKAEAERQQGAVPTLHAQTAALPADIGMPGKRLQLIAGTSFMLLAILGALLWLRPWQGGSVPPPSALAPQIPQQTTAAQPEAAVVAVAPQVVESAPTPVRSKPKTVARERTPKTVSPQTAQAPPPPAAPAPSAQTASSAAPATPIASRDLPGVSIGGYIYSEIPAERQLLVNKRLMHEGEEVMPGLRLEKMLPKAAIFNYQGQRYQVAY